MQVCSNEGRFFTREMIRNWSSKNTLKNLKISAEPLDQFWPNFTQVILKWRRLKFAQTRTIHVSKKETMFFSLLINIMVQSYLSKNVLINWTLFCRWAMLPIDLLKVYVIWFPDTGRLQSVKANKLNTKHIFSSYIKQKRLSFRTKSITNIKRVCAD